MNHLTPWVPDWQAKLYKAVNELGCSTVIEFARNRPSATWSQIAEELERCSGSRFAPVQFDMVFQSELKTIADWNYYIISSLVRLIREAIPNGWASGEDFRFRVATAFASWSACLPKKYTDPCRKVFHALMAKQLHEGWLPLDAEDPIILEALTNADFQLCGP